MFNLCLLYFFLISLVVESQTNLPLDADALDELSFQFCSITSYNLVSEKNTQNSEGYDWVDFTNVYILNISNQFTIHQSFLTNWLTTMKGSSTWSVNGINYAYPFEEIGKSKSHVEALAHFLFKSDAAYAIIIEDTVLLPLEGPRALLVDAFLGKESWDVVVFPINVDVEFEKQLPPPLKRITVEGESLMHFYVVKRHYAKSLLYPNIIESTTLLENAYNFEIFSGHSIYSFGNYLMRTIIIANDSKWTMIDNSLRLSNSNRAQLVSSQMSTISKYIFMIAIGKDYISKINWENLKRVILALNPSYSLFVYYDDDIYHFLNNMFPKYLELYNSLPLPQWKSDLVRSLLLYKYGGIYLDVDLKPVLGFDEIIYRCGGTDLRHIFIKSGNVPEYELYNGMIFASPKDNLFLILADLMLSDSPGPNTDYGINVQRFYSAVSLIFGVPQDYSVSNNIYFMRERRIGNLEFRYVIRIDENTVASYSNTKRNWPPKHNDTLYLSS